MTIDEEKAAVMNAFFASIFISNINFSVGTQPPELDDKDGEQNEAPLILEKLVSNLQRHLDMHNCATGWDRPKGGNGVD